MIEALEKEHLSREWLREYRENRGDSAWEASRIIGISRATIQEWESGGTLRPSPRLLLQAGRYYGPRIHDVQWGETEALNRRKSPTNQIKKLRKIVRARLAELHPDRANRPEVNTGMAYEYMDEVWRIIK